MNGGLRQGLAASSRTLATPLLGRHTVIRPALRHANTQLNLCARRHIIYLPAVLQPSFWKSLVPTFLRRRDSDAPVVKKKGWNPATFYIWMFLLIGSQAIQMLGLRNGYTKFTAETNAKLELLRGVIKKIQDGEKVDVEKVLGTGDEKREREWDEVVKELEAEDVMFRERRKKWKQKLNEQHKESNEKKEAVLEL